VNKKDDKDFFNFTHSKADLAAAGGGAELAIKSSFNLV